MTTEYNVLQEENNARILISVDDKETLSILSKTIPPPLQ